MKKKTLAIGVDFGGTNTKVGLVNVRGRVLDEIILKSREIAAPKDFVRELIYQIKQLIEKHGLRRSDLAGVGIGAPGPIDSAEGVVRSCVNVPGWKNVPLARMLAKHLGCPCRVNNDANLVGLGEWYAGSGRGSQVLVCVTLGTGVGGGLIVNGRVFEGATGSAGEIGHIVLDVSGQRCGCGNRGCLEAFIGTQGLLRSGRRALRQGSPQLKILLSQRGVSLTPELMAKAAHSGDSRLRKIWKDLGSTLGIGVANCVNVLNPDCVVIAGGVSNAWSLFRPSLLRTVRSLAKRESVRQLRLVRGALSDHAGIVGAAVLVWQYAGSGTGRLSFPKGA